MAACKGGRVQKQRRSRRLQRSRRLGRPLSCMRRGHNAPIVAPIVVHGVKRSTERRPRGDNRSPFRPRDRRQRVAHRDGARFVTLGFSLPTVRKRLGVVANSLDRAAQGRLVVF
jgi:hypothetical protein